ncbi:MAG: glutamate--tRNA ligase [Candidatus Doudnabacteria bacterium]|nr:glutamate--tRNA ligase [Candidatus Doudnabacteria bacterium]
MVRTRFAPSPTGLLHVGGLRTALFNFLFAKNQGGQFILRIEDTDQKRFLEGATENLIKTLQDFRLFPDEGPDLNSKFGPYIQSERLGIYKKYSEQLLAEDKAYYEESEAGRAVRFKMKKTGVSQMEDLVRGELRFNNDLQKDPILLKSDGFPVYNFANVIDDYSMEITHVIRGEEFLSSAPIYAQLYEAFGWQKPKFVHLPLILDRERKKLSKRAGDVAVEQYVKKGYLKEALLNFIALLGWNPKTTREIFGLEDLIEEFSLEKVNKSGAIFDITKLDFINREWQKKLQIPLQDDRLFARACELLKERLGENFSRPLFELIWPQVLERIAGPSDLEEKLPEFYFYFALPGYSADLLIWKNTSKEKIKSNLQLLRDWLQQASLAKYDAKRLEEKIKATLAERGVGTGEALWPLRVSLSGQKNSPSPFEIIAVFAQFEETEIFSRLDRAIDKLSA